eukprot:457047-Pleurochrysis_carterae.AAC.1
MKPPTRRAAPCMFLINLLCTHACKHIPSPPLSHCAAQRRRAVHLGVGRGWFLHCEEGCRGRIARYAHHERGGKLHALWRGRVADCGSAFAWNDSCLG